MRVRKIYNRVKLISEGMTALNSLNRKHLELQSLVIFKNLKNDKAVADLSGLLSGASGTIAEQVALYSSFVSKLYEEGINLTDYILSRVLSDENPAVFQRAQNLPLCANLEECLRNELRILEDIAQITAAEIRAQLGYDGYLPDWETREADFISEYANRMDNISSFGYGVFSKYHMFVYKAGAITPVHTPDNVTLSDLKSYEEERRAVIENTLALLKGRPAANVLLYGDAGTGKSSTVKAIVNEFRNRGLRLIEITKRQFLDIPVIVEKLGGNPLKFILFIDDLSFTKEHDDFGALKAILEGSVYAKAPNAIIYATSNRRHLVRESFADRNGDDVHRNETIQELVSLSERFGLQINFLSPEKAQYLHIVRELAAQYGLNVPDEALEAEAEKYALRRSGRSPRVARQFIEYLRSIEK